MSVLLSLWSLLLLIGNLVGHNSPSRDLRRATFWRYFLRDLLRFVQLVTEVKCYNLCAQWQLERDVIDEPRRIAKTLSRPFLVLTPFRCGSNRHSAWRPSPAAPPHVGLFAVSISLVWQLERKTGESLSLPVVLSSRCHPTTRSSERVVLSGSIALVELVLGSSILCCSTAIHRRHGLQSTM